MSTDPGPQRRSRDEILRERDARHREEMGIAPTPSPSPGGSPPRRAPTVAAIIALVAIAFVVASLLVARDRRSGARPHAGDGDPGATSVGPAGRRAPGIARLIRFPGRSRPERAREPLAHVRDPRRTDARAMLSALAAQVTNRIEIPTRADLPRQFVVAPTNDCWAPFECGARPADGDWARAEAAIAAAGAVEASLLWAGGPNTNLSQQQILSAAEGHKAAFEFPALYGLVAEERMPYLSGQPSSVDGRRLPPDVRAQRVGMVGKIGVYDEANLKSVLMACGPVVTYMNIYGDYDAFWNSEEWTYRPVPRPGETPWPIPVVLLGWDDDEDCWLIVDPWIGECDWDYGWRGADKGPNALGLGTWNVLYSGVATAGR